MCQTNAAKSKHFLIPFYGLLLAALPSAVIRRTSGHCKGFVVCHTACSSSSFVTAAPVSFAALHSFAPHFAPFHLVRSYAICFKAWPALLPHKSTHMQSHTFSQANATILTGFHFASFVATSFQSCSVHSLPIILLAGYPHFGFAQLANANCSCRTSISQSIAKLRLHRSAASVHFVKYTSAATHGAGIAIRSSWLYCQPLVGARRHFRSFLPTVPYGGSPPALQCGQVCRTAKLLFCRRRFYRLAVRNC